MSKRVVLHNKTSGPSVDFCPSGLREAGTFAQHQVLFQRGLRGKGVAIRSLCMMFTQARHEKPLLSVVVAGP